MPSRVLGKLLECPCDSIPLLAPGPDDVSIFSLFTLLIFLIENPTRLSSSKGVLLPLHHPFQSVLCKNTPICGFTVKLLQWVGQEGGQWSKSMGYVMIFTATSLGGLTIYIPCNYKTFRLLTFTSRGILFIQSDAWVDLEFTLSMSSGCISSSPSHPSHSQNSSSPISSIYIWTL